MDQRIFVLSVTVGKSDVSQVVSLYPDLEIGREPAERRRQREPDQTGVDGSQRAISNATLARDGPRTKRGLVSAVDFRRVRGDSDTLV